MVEFIVWANIRGFMKIEAESYEKAEKQLESIESDMFEGKNLDKLDIEDVILDIAV